MSELRFKVNELVRNAMSQAAYADSKETVLHRQYEAETNRLESELIATLEQQQAELVRLRKGLQAILDHVEICARYSDEAVTLYRVAEMANKALESEVR